MKTEDFDDAIRQKLEGIDQKVTEQDVEKVVRHLKKNRLWSRGSTGGLNLMFTLAAAAAAGLVLWYVIRNNRQLPRDDVAAGTTAVQSSESGSRTGLSHTPLSGPIDSGTFDAEGPASVSGKKHEVQTASATEGKVHPISNSGQAAAVNGAEPPLKGTGNTTGVSSEEPASKHPDTLSTSGELPPAIPPSTLPGQWINPVANHLNDSIVLMQPPLQIVTEKPDSLSILPVAGNGQAVYDSASPAGLLQPVSGPIDGGRPEHKNNILNVTGFSAGAGLEITGNSFGLGLTGRLMLINRFGLTAGIRYVDFRDEHFNSRDEFDKHGHHGRNPRFGEQLEDHDHATGIEIRSSLYQLPLALNYTVPMARKFGLGLSIGTDLDLRLKQRMGFNHEADSTGPPRRENFRSGGDEVLFNNLVLAISLEKEWKGMVFQLQPFIRPRFKELFYQPRKPDYGIGFGIMYKFSR